MMRKKSSLLKVPVFLQNRQKGENAKPAYLRVRKRHRSAPTDGDSLPSRPDEDFHLELKTPSRQTIPTG